MPSILAPVSYEPIKAVRVMSSQGATIAHRRAPEALTQTFKIGALLTLSSGYLVETSFGGADIIYGVASEAGHNLVASGVAQELSEGTPQNQPSAITTPVGAWMRDGLIGVYEANGQTVFSAALLAGQVFTQALLVNPATLYGLTKDATTGTWYLDPTDTAGNNAVAVLIGNDPSAPNTVAGGARVFFTFAPSKRFFI